MTDGVEDVKLFYMRKKTIKKYRGNFPSPDKMKKIGSIFDGEFEYGIFIQTKKSCSTWLGVKLALLGGARREKANFWIGWSVNEKKFSVCKDFFVLTEDYKNLYEQLTLFMLGYNFEL